MATSYHHGICLSLLSGLLAASAGLVAKLGLDQNQLTDTQLWPGLVLVIRLGLVGLTIALNCCMMTVYSRALALSPTAAEARYRICCHNPTTTSIQPNLTLTEVGFHTKMTSHHPGPPPNETHCVVSVVYLSSDQH